MESGDFYGVELFADAAVMSRGRAAAGWLLQKGGVRLADGCERLSHEDPLHEFISVDSCAAEYWAAERALFAVFGRLNRGLLPPGMPIVNLLLDTQSVVAVLAGNAKARREYVLLRERVHEAAKKLPAVAYTWIRRDSNWFADALTKLVLGYGGEPTPPDRTPPGKTPKKGKRWTPAPRTPPRAPMRARLMEQALAALYGEAED